MRSTLLLAALCLAVNAGPTDAETVLVVHIPNDRNGMATASPEVRDENSGSLLTGAQRARDWNYSIEFGAGEIVRRLRISVTGVENPPGRLPSLVMDPPFFYEGRLRLVLEPEPSTDTGAGAVSALWSTNVRGMSVNQLIEFNQMAAAVARARMKSLGGQWHNLHPYDVRSVFKYLESAVVLSRELYIIPPDDVLEARDWMDNAERNNPSKVRRGIGNTASARQIIKEIDSEEGNRFTLLWNEITSIKACDKRKPYLVAYKKWFLNVPSNQRRQKIIDVTRVPVATVESAIAQCVAEEAKSALASGSDEDKKAASTELQSQLRALEAVRLKPVSFDWDRRLASDILTLEGMLRAF